MDCVQSDGDGSNEWIEWGGINVAVSEIEV
jgi:hypothetical protein